MDKSFWVRSIVWSSLGVAAGVGIGCESFVDCSETRTCSVDSSTGGSENEGGAGGEGPRDTSGGAPSTSGGNAGTGGAGGEGGGGSTDSVCGDDGAECSGLPFVHVSVLGSDVTGDGSKEAPLRTIDYARRVALLGGQVLRVCNTAGSFVESLDWGADESGLAFEGGFSCEGFAVNSGKAHVIATSADGHRVSGATDIVLRNVHLEAPDAVEAGASSYGLFVVDSADVVFEYVDLTAGEGAAGADGAPYEEDAPDGLAGQNGYAQCGTVSARVASSRTCPNGVSSTGGLGGNGVNEPTNLVPSPGGNSTDALNEQIAGLDWGKGGFGKTLVADNCAAVQGATADAENYTVTTGHDFVTTSNVVASLSAEGFVPAFVERGFVGKTGGGGGGGGGAHDVAAGQPDVCSVGPAGGGGGTGGCGGLMGRAGRGGGGSFAFVSVDSAVAITGGTLSASVGGAGGAGSGGQTGGTGGPGGLAGTTNSTLLACAGAPGGNGADGGPGGGGTGGPSVGVAYVGAAPTQTSVTFSLPASPAAGGAFGPGATAIRPPAASAGLIAQTQAY